MKLQICKRCGNLIEVETTCPSCGWRSHKRRRDAPVERERDSYGRFVAVPKSSGSSRSHAEQLSN
jgi:hypothetical protein